MELGQLKIGSYHRYMIVVGLIPGSTKKLQQRLQKIYTMLLLLTNIAVSAYGIHEVHRTMDSKSDLMISLSMMTFCFLSDVSTCSVILLEVVTTYNQHVAFINKSYQIYMKFRHKSGYKICSGAFGAWMRRKYGCLAAVLAGSLLAYMLLAFFNYFYGFFWYSLMVIAIVRSRYLQMSLYVDIIHNYLQVLNKQLQDIVTIKLNKSLLLVQIDCCVVESLQRLLILKEIYTDIAQSVELFNEVFGWSIANIIVCYCLSLAVNVYWAFMAMDGFYPHQVLYSAISILIPLTTITIVFAYNCEQLHRSNSKTLSLVKQLIGISNTEYNAVAYEFSLQIHSKPLHVSAKGFFQANLGMIMALGAYIASMMVILVQFSLAEFADREYRITNITYWGYKQVLRDSQNMA